MAVPPDSLPPPVTAASPTVPKAQLAGAALLGLVLGPLGVLVLLFLVPTKEDDQHRRSYLLFACCTGLIFNVLAVATAFAVYKIIAL